MARTRLTRPRSPRIILDTNTLVSAFVFGGIPGQLFDRAGSDFQLVIARAGLDELEAVLARPKIASNANLSSRDRQGLVAGLERLAEVVERLPTIAPFEPDPKDTHLLACAKASKADYLVTGDKALLSLSVFHRTTIVTARSLLTQLKQTVDSTKERP